MSVAYLFVLDSGPLGLAAGDPGSAAVHQCLSWLQTLELSGVLFIVPEAADYEVRGELILKQLG